jgi:hypothetical protein
MKFIVKPLITLEGGSLENFEKTIMENKKVKKYYKDALKNQTISSSFTIENLNTIKKKIILDKKNAPTKVKKKLQKAVDFINESITNYKLEESEKLAKNKNKPETKKIKKIDIKPEGNPFDETNIDKITNKLKSTQNKNKYIRTLKSSAEKGNQLQQIIDKINNDLKYEKLRENIKGYLEHIGEDVNNITPTTICNLYSVMMDNYESLKLLKWF